jgi:putative DNA primase/helicase
VAPVNAADLAQALGGHRTSGQFLAKCPCHSDRSPSLAIRDGQLGPLVFCHAGCSSRDVIDELARRGLWEARNGRRCTFEPSRARHDSQRWEFATSEASDYARRIGFARHLWRESYDPRGTLAERYLNSRKLELNEDLALRVLRFHPACWWSKGEKLPCLVAAFEPITSFEPDEVLPQAILRVALTPSGQKIGKKMLGPVTGAAIKLDANADVTAGLHLAEGLETALAARSRQHWRPMWCTGAAGFIARFPVLADIQCVTIAADHDYAGLSAAQACAERWQAAGREAFIRWPNGLGHDYADRAT